MGDSADTGGRLYALYHLRTGFCRRRELVKTQFDEIAAGLSLELVWGRDAYASGALALLINKVGIFNGMFFRVSRAGVEAEGSGVDTERAGQLTCELVRDMVSFMTETRHVEGWRRIYLYVTGTGEPVLDPEAVPMLESQGLEIEPLLLEKLRDGAPYVLDLDPAPCPTCGS
jgi:hypothetical protein